MELTPVGAVFLVCLGFLGFFVAGAPDVGVKLPGVETFIGVLTFDLMDFLDTAVAEPIAFAFDVGFTLELRVELLAVGIPL